MTVSLKKRKKLVPWLLCGAFVLILLVVALVLRKAQPEKNRQNIQPDWSCLSGDRDGKLTYADDTGVTARWGVDLSVYQGTVDFQALKDSGVEFAILRLGYRGHTTGDIALDSEFARNAQEAAAVGMPIGVYFYSQATTDAEAEEEADFVVQQLGGMKLDYPVVYDQEFYTAEPSRADELTGEQATANALAFCRRIAASGYTPMIYLNHDWTQSMYDMDSLERYLLWFASYDEEPPVTDAGFVMWQYSCTGLLPGIESQHVDLNLWFDSTVTS
jgi:lysozyme